ncbi:unnamed protein product [Lota lota]
MGSHPYFHIPFLKAHAFLGVVFEPGPGVSSPAPLLSAEAAGKNISFHNLSEEVARRRGGRVRPLLDVLFIISTTDAFHW